MVLVSQISFKVLSIPLIIALSIAVVACEVDQASSDVNINEADMMLGYDIGQFSPIPQSDMVLDDDQAVDEVDGGEMESGDTAGAEVNGGNEDSGGNQGMAGEQDVAGEQGGSMTIGEAGVEAEPLSKSIKRGIAYNLTSVADLEALSSGISWWYNWSPQYDANVAEDYRRLAVDWMPMTWNGNNPDEIRAFLDDHPEVRYLLTYNEPNFQDQANMTPAYAASLWPTFEAIAEEYDLELVGPALNYCGHCVVVDGAPLGSNFTIWMDMFLDEFRAQFGREPRLDYTALHWYDYGLEDQIDEMVVRYGKPVWLTEFALWRNEDWATDELERQWLIDMVAFLEAHPQVHRYAWFTGRRPDFPKINLLAEDGVLTPLGEAYINAPYIQP